jgi:ferredoxin
VATHDVELRWTADRSATLQVQRDETVLDAAEATGLALPFGCLTGACGTCTARLVDADDATGVADAFDYSRAPRALKARHHDAGYVLLCVAEPRTDCRLRVGADVQAELVENPWK